jgi:putative SOS response-associated peptidase YedK
MDAGHENREQSHQALLPRPEPLGLRLWFILFDTMCGRYQLNTTAKQLGELFNAARVEGGELLVSRYNIAPGSPVLVVRDTPTGRAIEHVRWGLVPGWADDPKIGYKMINARSETAAEKPGFRGAMKYRRCIVPASGFYEWKKINSKSKQPHHIAVQGADVFGLAGLWELWQDPAGNELETCAILTCRPNEMMADLHDRMPVILDPNRFDAWLDTDQQDAAKAARLLKPYPADRMTAWPVSNYVNKAGNEGERCLEPVGQQGLFG